LFAIKESRAPATRQKKQILSRKITGGWPNSDAVHA